jgi:hypothetical protein
MGAASSLPKKQDEALARGFSAEQIQAHLRVQALLEADAVRDPVLEWRAVKTGPHEVFISGGIVEKALTVEEKVSNPMAFWDDDEDEYFMSTRLYEWAERELVFVPAFGKHAGRTILLRYSLIEDAKYGGDRRRGVLESSVMGRIEDVGVFRAGGTEDSKLVQNICELLLAGALDDPTCLGGPAEWRVAQRCWEAWPKTMQVTLHPPVMDVTTVTTKIPADGLPVRSAVALTLPALYHELIERGADEAAAVKAVERFAAAGGAFRVFRPDATPMLNLYERRSIWGERVPMNWDAVRKQWALPAAEGAGQTSTQAVAEAGGEAEAEAETGAPFEDATIAAFTIAWLAASNPADVIHDVIKGEISTGAVAAAFGFDGDLSIIQMDGSRATVQVSSTDGLPDIKAKVAEQTGVSCACQSLYHKSSAEPLAAGAEAVALLLGKLHNDPELALLCTSEPQEVRGLAHRFGAPPGSAWGVGIHELISGDHSFRRPEPGAGEAPQSLPADQIAALNQQQGSSAPCVIMPPPMTAAGAGAGAGTGMGAGASVGGLVHVFRATGQPWVQFCLNVTSEGNMCGGSHYSVWADGGWPASAVKLYVLCLLSEGGRLPRPARFCKAGRGVDLTFTSLKDELAALAGGGRTGGRARRSKQELCLSYK